MFRLGWYQTHLWHKCSLFHGGPDNHDDNHGRFWLSLGYRMHFGGSSYRARMFTYRRCWGYDGCQLGKC